MLSNIEKLDDGSYILTKDGKISKSGEDGDEDVDVEAEASLMKCGPASGACDL